jgi:hypothetical protein
MFQPHAFCAVNQDLAGDVAFGGDDFSIWPPMYRGLFSGQGRGFERVRVLNPW